MLSIPPNEMTRELKAVDNCLSEVGQVEHGIQYSKVENKGTRTRSSLPERLVLLYLLSTRTLLVLGLADTSDTPVSK